MLSLPFNPFSGLTAKIYGGIAIAAITFGAVQTVRIEGLRIWPLKIEGYAAANARLTAEKAAYIAAQREAEAKQKAADQSNIAGQLAAIRQQDAAHVQLEAARRSAVSEFRTAGRVRLEAACRSPSGAGVAPLRDNPRPPADGQAPGDFVAVKPEQIDAWSEIELQNAERGQFLRGLVSQGLAVPQSALPEVEFGGK